MKKIIKKIKLHDQESDRSYWMSQPPAKRIDALTQLVNQHFGIENEPIERLQRVLKITKRSLH